MSFQTHLIFEILLMVFASFSKNVNAGYENNPFLQGESGPVSEQTTNKPITQSPGIIPTSQQIPTTKEPTFTIEPPEILYGNELNKRCLKPRGQFPSYTCKNYVNCWDGVAVEQSCLGNFLFNPVKLYCDYPENVNCQGKPTYLKGTSAPTAIFSEFISTTSPIPHPAPSVKSNYSESSSSGVNSSLRKFCLRSTGVFAGSTCSKFVNCWNDNAVEQDCPTGLYFSSEGHCDYPEKVYCDNYDNNGGIPTKIQAKDGECPLEFGNFRNQSSCGQYYTCAFFKVLARYQCPDGLSFSDILGVCDYSYRVDCSKEPQFIDLREIHVKDRDCPLEFGNCRNRTNCTQYYTCAFYKVVAKYDCPEGLSFSDPLGVCDYSYRVDCSKEPQFIDLREVHAKDSDCPLEFGNFRNRTNCTQYYTCTYYKVVAKYDCPEGFSFSDLLGLCDYSYRVNCTREPQIFRKYPGITQGQKFSFNAFAHPDLLQPVSDDNPCTVKNGLVRDQENCSSYYLCESGKVAANYICPNGLKFSSELGICDYAEKVNCSNPAKAFEIGSNNVVVPNIPTEILSQVQRCVPGSVFRLNPQCTSACRCRNGSAEIIQCSAGLAYDSKTDKCVLPHLARC